MNQKKLKQIAERWKGKAVVLKQKPQSQILN